jgi:hypothetical protein
MTPSDQFGHWIAHAMLVLTLVDRAVFTWRWAKAGGPRCSKCKARIPPHRFMPDLDE